VVEDGVGPASVAVGSNGSLYGATADGGFGYGTVYSLTPPGNCRGGPFFSAGAFRRDTV
jgi:hypothetical protein